MKKIVIIMLALLSGLSVGGPVAAGNQSPDELVKETSKLMLDKLKEEKEAIKAKPGRIYELVNEIVLPHFDFRYMSQLVLAKHWRRANDSQRSAFTEEFKVLLVRTYATSLSEYADQEVIYLPYRPGAEADKAVVKMEVEQPGGFPIPIDYRLHDSKNGWKVFDVIIDGVSLVTNYRSTFSQEIREKGVDGLIKTLAERNKQATNE